MGGWLSDGLGRLRSIALGSVVGIMGYAGLLLAPTWQWFLLAESLNNIPMALVAPSYVAYVAENSLEAHRSRLYAVVKTLFTIVAIVGPPLGGWLAQGYGFQTMLVVAAAKCP